MFIGIFDVWCPSTEDGRTVLTLTSQNARDVDEIFVTDGEKFTLYCRIITSVTKLSRPVRVSIMLRGHALISNDYSTVPSYGSRLTLDVKQVNRKQHEGNYTCETIVNGEKVVSETITLTFTIDSPNLTRQTSTLEETDANFVFNRSEFPDATFTLFNERGIVVKEISELESNWVFIDITPQLYTFTVMFPDSIDTYFLITRTSNGLVLRTRFNIKIACKLV